ncbi:RecX family transcriptional regulator [Caenispirillum bisanense]|uniref:RecX family transcriptional regulator n=1 Tax=Caenispirillum bisanense TaxID=414052 RepID=UPI0031D4B34F
MTEKITPPAAADATAARRRKRPRKVTADYLENAALYYLERFATSAANLRRVLLRKVELSAREHGTDRDDGAALVEALVARYQAAGLLDDAAYAAGRARSLHRQGGSTRAIRARLAAKGVAAAVVEEAVEDLSAETDGNPDVAAAIAFARRRGFGPFRRPALGLRAAAADPAERRLKELAAMARAGFSFDIAARVIDAPDRDALDDLLAGG